MARNQVVRWRGGNAEGVVGLARDVGKGRWDGEAWISHAPLAEPEACLATVALGLCSRVEETRKHSGGKWDSGTRTEGNKNWSTYLGAIGAGTCVRLNEPRGRMLAVAPRWRLGINGVARWWHDHRGVATHERRDPHNEHSAANDL